MADFVQKLKSPLSTNLHCEMCSKLRDKERRAHGKWDKTLNRFGCDGTNDCLLLQHGGNECHLTFHNFVLQSNGKLILSRALNFALEQKLYLCVVLLIDVRGAVPKTWSWTLPNSRSRVPTRVAACRCTKETERRYFGVVSVSFDS